MIIKMETQDAIAEAQSDGNGKFTQNMVRDSSWMFIDDLKLVETSIDDDLKGIGPDDYDEVYMSVYREPATLSSDKRKRITAKRKSNGSEIVVISERKVYLLNDDGKTIERLN